MSSDFRNIDSACTIIFTDGIEIYPILLKLRSLLIMKDVVRNEYLIDGTRKKKNNYIFNNIQKCC